MQREVTGTWQTDPQRSWTVMENVYTNCTCGTPRRSIPLKMSHPLHVPSTLLGALWLFPSLEDTSVNVLWDRKPTGGHVLFGMSCFQS